MGIISSLSSNGIDYYFIKLDNILLKSS